MKLCKISIKDNVASAPSDFWLRLWVSSVALPCVVLPLYFGYAFYLVLLLSVGAFYEWSKICRVPVSVGFVLLITFVMFCKLTSYETLSIMLLTLMLVTKYCGVLFSFASLYIYGGLYGFLIAFHHNPSALLVLLSFIWLGDISAYFTGRLLKGPKLAPSISPGKTWSGFIGGITIPVFFFSGLALFFLPSFSRSFTFFLTVLSFSAHMGDLLESKMKRHFGIKDSGCCFPGHGGLLDRLDSVFLVGWVLVILKFCHTKIPFVEM